MLQIFQRAGRPVPSRIAASAALPDAPAVTKSRRTHEIDGLRGWAALVVVCMHNINNLFGSIHPAFASPLTFFLFDGGLAVSIFFVLSGDALSTPFFNGGGKRIVGDLALKRYARLAVPILFISLIVYALMAMSLVHNGEAAHVLHREKWIGAWLQYDLTLGHTLRYALFDVFGNLSPKQAIDPFLWTMRTELFGSFLVFALLLLSKRSRWFWHLVLAVAVVGLLFYVTRQFSCFLFGMMFAKLRSIGWFAAARQNRRWQYWNWPVLLALLVAQGAANFYDDLGWIQTLAVLVVLCVFTNAWLSAAVSGSLSRLLGRLSFPVYLVQYPILISITSSAVIYAAGHGGITTPVALAISFSSIALTILAAYLFLPVEVLTRAIGRAIVGVTRKARSAIPPVPAQ